MPSIFQLIWNRYAYRGETAGASWISKGAVTILAYLIYVNYKDYSLNALVPLRTTKDFPAPAPKNRNTNEISFVKEPQRNNFG
jgi:hypothetical protein